MNILVFDCESYGVEYLLWRTSDEVILAKGTVTGIATRTAILKHRLGVGHVHQMVAEMPNCRAAMKWITSSLVDPKIGAIGDLKDIGAVGLRVAHGASKYTAPTPITNEVLE